MAGTFTPSEEAPPVSPAGGPRAAAPRPPFQRVVVGLELTQADDEVIRAAGRLGRGLDARLHLAHVVSELAQPSLAPCLARTSDQALEAIAHHPALAGVRCERPHLTSTRGHAIDEALRGWARERRADLLLLGARGRPGAARFLLGATAERAVRTAPCPVWLVRPGAPPGPIRRILCAVDGSAAADAALSVAGRLAGCLGADLAAVCVLPRLDGPLALTLRPPIPRARATARGFRAALARADLGAVPVRVVCRRGRTDQAILRAAAELQADLLVLGCAGRTGLRRLGRPNTAERVLRGAPCDLLVVPPLARAASTAEGAEAGPG